MSEQRETKVSKYSKEELESLVMYLSTLLDRAIATGGELSPYEWEQMQNAQNMAYFVKHPEVLER